MINETYEWSVEFTDDTGRHLVAKVEAPNYMKAVIKAREKVSDEHRVSMYKLNPLQIRREGVAVRFVRVEHDARAH